MAKFKFSELVTDLNPRTARLGAGTGTANNIDDKEVGKFVKLVGDSQYDLAAAGDPIEGFIVAVEPATLDGYSIGTIAGQRKGDRKAVVLDGAQATPGTGTIAIGDYVVVGTVVAKGTALAADAKVTKATIQPGTTEAAALTDVNDQIKAAMFAWRLVSASGTAVGDTGIIERV